jgi:hypothetical protein
LTALATLLTRLIVLHRAHLALSTRLRPALPRLLRLRTGESRLAVHAVQRPLLLSHLQLLSRHLRLLTAFALGLTLLRSHALLRSSGHWGSLGYRSSLRDRNSLLLPSHRVALVCLVQRRRESIPIVR